MIYDTTDKNNFETNDAPYKCLTTIAIKRLVKCYPITTFYSHQTSSLLLSKHYFLVIRHLVFKKLSKHYSLVIRHLVHCHLNTSFKFSDVQFKAIQTLSFNQLCLVYSHLSCHFFMSIVSLLLSNDQFLTMSMMALLAKSYLKTSLLAYEKLQQFYSIFCTSKS